MDMVERVTKAIEEVTVERQGQGLHLVTSHGDSTAFAKAAIRAMLEGLEPVAWRYECGEVKHVFLVHRQDINGIAAESWTETPLYDLSALKEVVEPK